MLRQALLATADSPRLRGWIETSPAGKAVIRRFVAGQDIPGALQTGLILNRQNMRITIDHLGEYTTDPQQAIRIRDEYLHLIEFMPAVLENSRPDVSIKLSALGQTLTGGQDLAFEHAHRICDAAAQAGVTVTLDMEDHTTTDSTLSILDSLRQVHPSVGVAVQARLRRTEEDCGRLAEMGCRVRLCKGAYAEPATVAFKRNDEAEQSFKRCTDVLMRSPTCYPMIATHHPHLVEYAINAALRQNRSSTDHEYQMLYGVRPAEQQRLAASGHTVRIYLPYGADSTAYLIRRLAERPANVMLLLRALASQK